MNEDEESKLIEEGICPICKNKLSHKEGCVECEGCGWSVCKEA